MQLERKLTTVALVAVALTASLAFAQVSSIKKGPGGSGSQGGGGALAGGSVFDGLQLSPMQECLMDLFCWEQSRALNVLGGTNPANFNALPDGMKDARMEVVRACNLYHRSTLTSAQQEYYDKAILDPKGHPLPAKWEQMRLRGTLVSSLLKSDNNQQRNAQLVLDTFRERNHAIWGTGWKNGGYEKNLTLLHKEFRSNLNKQQLAEFDKLWSGYKGEVASAIRAGSAAQR